MNNRYPGTCALCGTHVEAQQGVAYQRPRVKGWFVKCGTDACAERVAAEKATAQQAARERHFAGSRYAEAVATAAEYANLPKKIVVPLDGGADGPGTVTFVRSNTRAGVLVKITREFPNIDLTSVERERCYTDAEAIAAVVTRLRHLAEPFFDRLIPKNEYAAAILAAAKI
jgi:hypothetical protein